MIVELGHFALLLAFFVACLQAVIPLYGAHTNKYNLMALALPTATIHFILLGIAFAALTYAFVTSDFSLRLVVLKSHSLKPMIYKI